VLATVHHMALTGDTDALQNLWRLLGGVGPLSADGTSLREFGPEHPDVQLITELIRKLCGKGDPYAAERTALAELAKTMQVDAAKYAAVEPLEDALLEAMAARLQEKLDAMTPEERQLFFEDMVRRMSDEERIRLIDQALAGYDAMTDAERREFVKRLAHELGLDEDEVASAIAGGAATLLPLLLAKQGGFKIFLWTTQVMAAAASSVGLTIPFAVYIFKNRALGWLLGPVGMLVTTALSGGWFAVKTWRRKERFRKLVQVIAYTSAWRSDRDELDG
jgi:hypothetical protein